MIIKEAPRGSRIQGLVYYAFDEKGFTHAHENSHLVAAWDESWKTGEQLSKAELYQLGQELDAPRRLAGHRRNKGDVMHLVMAVDKGVEGERGSDRLLSDEEWHKVARASLAELGLAETPDKAGVPWALVRHSDNHVHLMLTLTREDDTRVNEGELWTSKGVGPGKRLRAIAERFEDEFDLYRTGRGAGTRGLSRGEYERAGRAAEETATRGQAEPREPGIEIPAARSAASYAPTRERLESLLRSAGAQATNEAEFVEALGDAGVLVFPNWGRGARTEAKGYSVALGPAETDGTLVRISGRNVAKDLSLVQLRKRWEQPTEDQAAENAAAWRSAQDASEAGAPARSTKSLGRDAEAATPDEAVEAELWRSSAKVIAGTRKNLEQVPAGDAATWSRIASDAAGTLSVLADRLEPDGRGPLHRASRSLAASAQHQMGAGQPALKQSLIGPAPFATAARAIGGAYLASRGGYAAVFILIAQLGRTAMAIQAAHEQAGRLQHARRAQAAADQLLSAYRDGESRGLVAVAEAQRPAEQANTQSGSAPQRPPTIAEQLAWQKEQAARGNTGTGVPKTPPRPGQRQRDGERGHER